MANNIDEELYLDNNSFIVGRPTKKDLDGSGVETDTELAGLTDFKVWLSLAATHYQTTDAIHADLVITLTEVASLGVYKGVLTGAAKRTHLGATADNATLYVHWQSESAGYHEVSTTLLRKTRPAATS